MQDSHGRRFLRGLTAGTVGTLIGGGALLYALSHYEVIAFADNRIHSFSGWLDWAYMNLGSSIPVFAVLLLVFFFTLGKLRSLLDNDGPLDRVVQMDHLTDIYAMGVILYEMLSGHLPFEGEQYNQLLANILTQEPKDPRSC